MHFILYWLLGLILLSLGIVLQKHSAFFTWHLQKYSVKRLEDTPYIPSSKNPKHRLDIYLPRHSKGYPVVHFIYGGYWVSGDKRYRRWLTGLYGNIGASLARRGIGVVVSNYRPSPEVNIEGQISDAVAAIGWTAKHARQLGGSGKLYVMGHSAGAHIISLLAANPVLYKQKVNPKMISGYIALSPVLDIEALVRSHDKAFNQRISFPVFGKTVQDWHEYSPISHFLAKPNKSLRLLILIGENDFEHIRKTASMAHNKMKKADLPAKFETIPSYYHTALVTRFGQRKDPVIRLVLDFIKS